MDLAQMSGAKMSGAKTSGHGFATWQTTYLYGAQMSGAKLSGAKMPGALRSASATLRSRRLHQLRSGDMYQLPEAPNPLVGV